MDITKYRVFVKDYGLTDDEFETIASVVLGDIFVGTETNYTGISSTLKHDEKEIDLMKKIDSSSDTELVYSLGKSIPVTTTSTTDIQIISIIDATVTYENNNVKEEISLIYDGFLVNESGNKYIVNTDALKSLFGTEYNIDIKIIATVSIAHGLIDETMEEKIRNAFIAGIQYYASTTMQSAQDTQTEQFNSQVYYRAKQALMYRYGNQYSVVDHRTVENSWKLRG